MHSVPYAALQPTWPRQGRHILARFDADTIDVYQAYRPAIAQFAVAHQRFGGAFSYDRMSWIKPNFLWMMYRAGWAQKEGQERILAIRLPRAFFDALLRDAVPSTFDPVRFASRDAWKNAVQQSDVRLQWDPDHAPDGSALPRRALQLGLRGQALRQYGERQAISITDITDFVHAQAVNLQHGEAALQVPHERVYVPPASAAQNVGLDEQ
ncbi:DUF4291 domain-containing protein [Xanthomonas sp. A2111]|uniref:DUF4291 domain-containing protein n=1 Tax=Xanthomonas hawaiiensis TaxID=3003247 RepID=A0ABU2I7N5_9XANT|nr:MULTISPECIES: DUF4291 domain-containing protein [unclassified Xanthomonas]MBO9827767.1 DUF4291 domain-containing protein [Xanthomonas sp. A2111]MBO9872210.1 DUF4291 domain-containing protein [Xanthomonas sp. D-93]MDS9994144.1 DUF4291 domain-containing protein [Xanthomonas sp. A2111]WNH45867.1 DUF4291 domain-containing protein [Xanthomonas sp. A6251]